MACVLMQSTYRNYKTFETEQWISHTKIFQATEKILQDLIADIRKGNYKLIY